MWSTSELILTLTGSHVNGDNYLQVVCVWGVPKTGKSTQPDLGWSHKKARVGMNWETDHSIYWYEKMEVHGNVQASNGN